MGLEVLRFYKERVKREYKIAFFFTCIVSLMIHLYKFTNTLLNHDSVYNYYYSQNVLGSGRWALSLACGISSYYDLPWVNGVLSCVYIALTMVVIVAIFKMKNPVLIGLGGGYSQLLPLRQRYFSFFTQRMDICLPCCWQHVRFT